MRITKHFMADFEIFQNNGEFSFQSQHICQKLFALISSCKLQPLSIKRQIEFLIKSQLCFFCDKNGLFAKTAIMKGCNYRASFAQFLFCNFSLVKKFVRNLKYSNSDIQKLNLLMFIFSAPSSPQL